MSYADAYDIQCQTHAAVLARQAGPTLLLVEHDPVITISRRRGVGDHLLASPDALGRLGIDTQPTDRGGDITYHGPGQLVAYPIIRLDDFALSLGSYMRLLEQVVIDAVADFGVAGHRVAGCTGVWVELEAAPPARPRPRAKLAAMGVRVRRNVTLHGLALNVNPDMSHYETIVPCGITGKAVTSLTDLLGPAAPTMAQVKVALVGALGRRVGELAAARAEQGPS